MSEKKNKIAMQLLALMLNWNVITGTIEAINKLFGFSSLTIVSNITILFSLIFFLLTILFSLKNTGNIKLYLFMFIWIILFSFSYLLNPGIYAIIPRAFIYFANNIFCIALLMQLSSDFKLLIIYLKNYIPITLVYAILQWFIRTNNDIYSMSFSYSIMVSLLLCLLLFVRQTQKSFKYLIYFLFLFITNFKYGSRGGFVCCAIAFILNYFLLTKRKQVKYIVISIVSIFVMLASWEQIITIAVNFFPNSRNSIILSQGIPFYGAGRFEKYHKVANEFIQNPFTIRGLYSDRLLLSEFSQDINKLWGSYTHNIILELLYQFGVWCIPIILAFLIYMTKLFINVKNKVESVKIIVIIAYSFSFGQLLISSSYLITPSSGLLIGILFWSKLYQSNKNAIRRISLSKV